MSEEGIEKGTAKELRVGKYIAIDGIPCKVVDIETSSPGKHGAAKMRITAIGIFDGQKKSIIKPSSSDCDVPIIDKKKAQVVSVSGDNVQLMDSDTYEVYDLPITEEFRGKIAAGQQVEVIEAMGKRGLLRVY
jgi:translation initiation factor 5A